MNNIC